MQELFVHASGLAIEALFSLRGILHIVAFFGQQASSDEVTIFGAENSFFPFRLGAQHKIDGIVIYFGATPIGATVCVRLVNKVE